MTDNLIIRADSDTRIGAGHVMRCIALAQAWKAQGGSVTFLSHCEGRNLPRRIIDEGFRFTAIERPHPDPDDLEFTLDILRELNTHNSRYKAWVVVDGYHFTPDYHKAIMENGFRLMIIDDMAQLNHYHAHILLNQNIHASNLRYSCDRDTVKLLGTEYVMLRREFLKYSDWKREIPNKANKLLVTMGGGDSNNVTLKVLKALDILKAPSLEVKIVIGPENPNIVSLEKELSRSCFRFEILSGVESMSELMAWADLAVSSGGSTCWELAFMGLPSLILTVANNQIQVAEGLAKVGAGIYLGWHENITIKQCAHALGKIIQDKNTRSDLSEHGRRTVNGKCYQHIVNIMQVGQIQIRKAHEDDCNLLWDWVNDLEIRKASFSSAPISWDDHLVWFRSKINSPNCFMYIATIDNSIPLGQIRFDISQENAVISISIDRRFRGKGFGAVLIRETSEILFSESNVRRVHAYIKHNNHESKSVFTKASFKKGELTNIFSQQAIHFILERFDTDE